MDDDFSDASHDGILHSSSGFDPGPHQFKALSNLEGDVDIPDEEMEAINNYILQQIASTSRG